LAPEPTTFGDLDAPFGNLSPPAPFLATSVESVEELPGQYYRPFAPAGQLSWLSLGAMAEGDGDYQAARSCGIVACVAESGRYHAIPENPAIGFAFLALYASGGETSDNYMIQALWRDPLGHLIALQLRQFGPTGPGLPFLIFRLPGLPTTGLALGEPATPEPQLASAANQDLAMADLAGTYVRALPVYGEIGALTLDAPAWSGGSASGSFEAALPYCLPWCFPLVGDYHLELHSAIIGAGVLELRSENPADPPRRYLLQAAWRDLAGDLVALQVARVTSDGLVTAPFLLWRQWWTTS
jgi:hypothetical protein